jgi:hypothetical protein
MIFLFNKTSQLLNLLDCSKMEVHYKRVTREEAATNHQRIDKIVPPR